MTWAVTVLALVGLYLNVKGRWQGFLLWIFSNAFWCVHNAHIEQWAQSVLFGVFFIISAVGIWQWRKASPRASLVDRLRAADIAIKTLSRDLEKAKEKQKLTNKQISKLLWENTQLRNNIATMLLNHKKGSQKTNDQAKPQKRSRKIKGKSGTG